MEFGVLGPVAVWVDGRPEEVGPPKRRLLLAVLLLELGRIVSVDRLIDLLWDEDPPRAARRVIFAHVSRLRQLFEKYSAGSHGVRLETAAPGYVLYADPEQIDVYRFQRLVKSGKPREALELWRGEALSDVPHPALCRQLNDLHMSTIEDRVDADLQAGRHRELITELSELVTANPVNERLVGMLMLALYRSSRQAEALDAFTWLRTRLVDELGIDPGPELCRLHEAILRNDPGLLTNGHAPAQLPADVSGFTGRQAQLKALDGISAIALVTGSAGIGKTALAVHWGHRTRSRFPDGQLYVNLRGFAPTPALRPIDALGQLLSGLGVPIEDVPVDLEPAAALYRSTLSDRRALVVLDNAETAEQVRPLLPGGRQCLAIVTSRNRLSGLVAREGARRVDLDVLGTGEALSLLADVLGPTRVDTELAAATELAERCACLPLALRIAAARILDIPRYSIRAYVAELASGSRLTALAVDGDEEAAVRVAIDLSYAKLPDTTRLLFRRLGLVPGPDWTVEAAAAVSGMPVDHRRLLTAHLAEERAPGRFSSHDLLRHYARERIVAEDNEAARSRARQRLFDWYLTNARAAGDVLNPQMVRLPAPQAAGMREMTAEEAMRWLDDERANLIAAIEDAGAEPAAWLLADALRSYFALNRRTAEWLAVAAAGLKAAEAAGDLAGQAAAHLNLAQAQHRGMDNVARAIEHNLCARELANRAGWDAGEATALGNLGNGYRAAGRLDEAVACYRRAYELERRAGRIAGQGFALSNLGVLLTETGDLVRAVDHLERALALRRAVGYHAGEARTLCYLADAVFELGQLDRARSLVREAIRLYREVGERVNEAAAVGSLAKVLSETGEHDQALIQARSALDILRDFPSRWIESTVLGVLATIEQRQGRYRAAADHREQALRLARAAGNRFQEANLLIGLAHDRRLLGDPDDAARCAETALDLARRIGLRVLERQALDALAHGELAPVVRSTAGARSAS